MSGIKINDYSNSDSNILAMQSTLDKTFFGKIDSITLTEFDSSTVPAIAAGSVVENNGAIYSFSSEESISLTDPVTSATVADGAIYVCLVPGTGTITAAFTATAPTFSDSRQGFYGTGDEANYRYVARCVKASTAYTEKYIMVGYYQYIERALINVLEIGEANMYWNGFYSVGSFSEDDFFNVKKPCNIILTADATTVSLSVSTSDQSTVTSGFLPADTTDTGTTIDVSFSTTGGSIFLQPGQYKLINDDGSMILIGAYGITSITATNVDNVIEIL